EMVGHAAGRPRLLGGCRARHQRRAGERAGPHHARNARSARHREGQALCSRCAAKGHPRTSLQPGVEVWPGKHWEYSLYLKETNQEVPDYTQLDERASWFYEAVGVTVGMMGRTVGAG